MTCDKQGISKLLFVRVWHKGSTLDKDKVPDRLAKLETEVHQLNQKLPDLIENCYASLYMVLLSEHRWNEDEALQKAKSVGNDFLKHLLTLG